MLYKYNNINQTTLKILGLFKSNYKASFHLREIAREIQVDVKAVRAQLDKLEKSNIITSVQKGKNKEYSLNLSNYLTIYHVILAEAFASIDYLSKHFEIRKLVSEINGNLGNVAVLFGSFAKENMTDESDIDIIVIADKKPEEKAFREMGSLIDRKINVKFATPEQFSKGLISGDPLIREVVANHVVLKGIDNFCDIMWRYYAKR
jgi:predicted nucleotidyltransferase